MKSFIVPRPSFAGRLLFCGTAALAVLHAAPPNRVLTAVDDARRVTLAGHLQPQIHSSNDLGAVESSLLLPRLSIHFKKTADQQAQLAALLANQQDPKSPLFHKWLSPEEFAERFGASDSDIAQIQTWLAAKGFSAFTVSRSHTFLSFSGTAEAAGAAFHAGLHYYNVAGVKHFANATAPTIPAAFLSLVGQIHGLTDFRPHPPRLKTRVYTGAQPRDTSGSGEHFLAPGDVSIIYDVEPVYSNGFKGSGVGIAVVGQTGINVSDLEQFRSQFNLAGSDPETLLVPNTRDPGISKDDVDEADLDLEWSSAMAPASTVHYVYSWDVIDALNYVIDQNIAPVISMSYGYCEASTTASDAQSMQAAAQQANAQGITWIAASGDAGATDCSGDGSGNNSTRAVDLPAAVPEVTGMGGAEFVEGSGNYWNISNSPGDVSAVSYIPETAWNDSVEDGEPSASGGGASVYFSKPAWQAGPGVPADGARDVPDISLSASADHDGYMVYSSGQIEIVGGTSAPVPVFAGLTAVLNQYLMSTGFLSSPGLGNINPTLYALAQTTSNVIHDITTGNNEVTPTCGRRGTCSSTPIGFTAGVGYDQVTGLGTLDVNNMFNAWSTASSSTPKSTGEPPVVSAVVNGASFQPGFAPGEIASVFGTNLASAVQGAPGIPLPDLLGETTVTINGFSAPFFYVSPGQINLQIPYEVAANAPATLTLTNNGASSTFSFTTAAAAPGIFGDSNGFLVPSATVPPGGITTLYMTGDGLVSPGLATGSAPAATTGVDDLPKPELPVTVTVGNVTAPIEFIGIPWLVGVTQINFQVPDSVPAGTQNLVVNVGGISSPPVKLTVQ